MNYVDAIQGSKSDNGRKKKLTAWDRWGRPLARHRLALSCRTNWRLP